jgi:hypothetical protein
MSGIENATHNTFAKQTWMFSASISRFVSQMYYGLYFQFRRGHYHSWNTLYIYNLKEYNSKHRSFRDTVIS